MTPVDPARFVREQRGRLQKPTTPPPRSSPTSRAVTAWPSTPNSARISAGSNAIIVVPVSLARDVTAGSGAVVIVYPDTASVGEIELLIRTATAARSGWTSR